MSADRIPSHSASVSPTRYLPGVKDFETVSVDGAKIPIQKRLMMFPLREAFPLFVQDNPGIKISFSKFCAFKPEWIKIANQKQTHVVCMCIKHQNPKLSF